jgi:predicted  nucleic acid-binding Zn-ribbon protein
MDKQLAAKNTALLHASTSLDAAADALTAVNTEAQRRIAQAKTDKAAADKAAIAAQAAQHAAEARLAALQQHEQQARKRPGCAALLDTDLLQVCGL